jgi:hypothetical protein
VGDERKKKAGHGGGEGGAPVTLFRRSLCKAVLYEDNNVLLFCVLCVKNKNSLSLLV